jgi:hypothetical protein
MQGTKHSRRSKQPGGLSGKARRNRYKGRAARMYTQQMIDEFLEEGERESQHERYIPVRGRSEFLPSAQCPGSEVREEPKQRPAIRLGSPTGRTTTAPVVRPARPPKETEPQEPEAFTIRGFFYGCAMGSAAAAVILLLVQVVIP